MDTSTHCLFDRMENKAQLSLEKFTPESWTKTYGGFRNSPLYVTLLRFTVAGEEVSGGDPGWVWEHQVNLSGALCPREGQVIWAGEYTLSSSSPLGEGEEVAYVTVAAASSPEEAFQDLLREMHPWLKATGA